MVEWLQRGFYFVEGRQSRNNGRRFYSLGLDLKCMRVFKWHFPYHSFECILFFIDDDQHQPEAAVICETRKFTQIGEAKIML